MLHCLYIYAFNYRCNFDIYDVNITITSYKEQLNECIDGWTDKRSEWKDGWIEDERVVSREHLSTQQQHHQQLWSMIFILPGWQRRVYTHPVHEGINFSDIPSLLSRYSLLRLYVVISKFQSYSFFIAFCLSVRLCKCPYVSVCLCMYLYASECICVFLYAPVCPSMSLYAPVCPFMSLYAPVCLSMSLYVSPRVLCILVHIRISFIFEMQP